MANNLTPQQQFIPLNSSPEKPPKIEEMGVSMPDEIDRLEDLILNGTRIPFMGKTLIDEDTLINQLDLIRINIPDCLQQATQILQQREQILSEAQNYAQKIVENAQRRAAQLLDESRIVQQAESQAHQIRRQVQQDCENLQRKTINEVEQIRQKIQQEAIKTRQQAILEAEDIQNEADIYADSVLGKLEKDLSDMLRVVHNGRQQVHNQKVAPQPRQQDMTIAKKAS
ncbi:archaeal/vacuolar-type H+-ATPase subunit H [Geminocystis sp. NIES-3708]|uniref:ATP synthase F0 subunit B n=1 Tax=Geminocystis sp. NIES-3708 TaxID=1615909 RepID=UPI0005FC576E|nr:ATP synthase F0 subunit B [Geminocystis sp. NIES-3708]BAQ62732.1 archaeal/vacuolar-type H+-ATPase subunit H [Geminocystis sp. NIES-3708]